MSLLQFLVSVVTWIYFIYSQKRPICSKGISLFVANPTATWTSVAEAYSHRLQSFHCLPSSWKVVVCASVYRTCVPCSSIVAVASVCTVKPYLENIAVLCQQFFELSMEIFAVEWCAIESLMPVPRREIYSKLKSVFLACSRQFANDVSFAIFIWSVAYAVICIFCLPQAKAIMMFCCYYDTFHACFLANTSPLLTVETCRVEIIEVSITVAPFPVAECV